jgi:glycosyltransferase involved in cell wall biosynthesis
MSDGRPGSGKPTLAAVIPAYRAAEVLPGVLARLARAVPHAAVIVVDDGSDDDTARAAARAGAAVLRHPVNLGKGHALATGLAAAVEGGHDIVVTLDADGQHPPEAIPLLVAPVASGAADLVVGARARAGGKPLRRKVANWLSSTLLSRAVGFVVPDSQSGFRAMRREVAGTVRPGGERYEYETEFLFDAARRGYRISAVPVATVYDGAPSHFRYGADTLALASVFLRHWRGVLLGPES